MLNLPEAAAFEEHYITCARCAGIVEDADRYVDAMQEAARMLRGFDRKRAGTATD